MAEQLQSATLEITRVALSEIHEDPSNPRAHDSLNVAAIKGSLARFGQVEPLLVQEGTGRIIAGHGRKIAMLELGMESADVIYIDLHSVDATALAIALNRSAELADWDDNALSKLLTELQESDSDLFGATGFNDESLNEVLARLEDGAQGVEEGEIPDPPDDPMTKRGDLWILGDHRLLCGDAALDTDVDRLLDGQPIHLVNTDPPYNVRVEPRSANAIAAGLSSFKHGPTNKNQKFDAARGKAGKPKGKMRAKDRPLENDYMTDEEFEKLLRVWFRNLSRPLLAGHTYYIWGGYANVANYPAPLDESELYFAQCLIWVKGHPVLTRKDYMGNHEWCFYGWKKGGAHRWFGPHNISDTWEVQKISPQKMVHLTEKPVELATRAMEYSSKRGENVLDLFGGSGSTLIGAESMGRIAFLMEIDPAYCDVIIQRWQSFSRLEAVLDETGQTYRQIEDSAKKATESVKIGQKKGAIGQNRSKSVKKKKAKKVTAGK